MSRQQLMGLYQRQIDLGGMSSGGEGGLFSAQSRAGLAEYQAWRKQHPGLSRDELKLAWRQHKKELGEPAPGSKPRKPVKGVRHCFKFKDVETKKGLARRCETWAKGPRPIGSALVGGYSDMAPMRGMALVGGARMSKGVRHCMERALGPSGMSRCKQFMPGPRSAMHSGSALVGGFPGQRDILSAWSAMHGQCRVTPKERAARAAATKSAKAAYDASYAQAPNFVAGAKAAARALGVELSPAQLNKLRPSRPRKEKAAEVIEKAVEVLEQKAEVAHEAAAQLEVAAEQAAAQGEPAAAAELAAAASQAEAMAHEADVKLTHGVNDEELAQLLAEQGFGEGARRRRR